MAPFRRAIPFFVAFLLATVAGRLFGQGGNATPQYLENPSFEQVDKNGAPQGWSVTAWGADQLDPKAICSTLEQPGAPAGRRVARIATTGAAFCDDRPGAAGARTRTMV